MKLNQLTRWYVITAFILTSTYLTARMLQPFLDVPSGQLIIPMSYGAVLMFFGGIGIKFLPSSLGGNPHVYSLRMALWSYWFIIGGTVIWSMANFFQEWLIRVQSSNVVLYNALGTAGPLLMLCGSGFLAVNLWKTMKNRV